MDTINAIRVGDLVQTPHASNGRRYEVTDLAHYANDGQPRAMLREPGTRAMPFGYPADLLTVIGRA